DAIKMDVEVDFSTGDRFGGLLMNKQRLAKPNSYFHKIHPSDASEVDGRLAADRLKAQAKAKADAEAKGKPAAGPAGKSFAVGKTGAGSA
ncbi:MAG: hypothetical protein WCR20_24025, partial [Verrucomicrobiota bacterium]